MVEILLIIQGLEGKDEVLKVMTYLVDTEATLLCVKRTLQL